MSDSKTKVMLASYKAPSLQFSFFSSLCKLEVFSSEAIDLDIERDDEDVAIVVTSYESGARANESTIYSNKEYVPPLYKEKMTIPAGKLTSRLPGQATHTDPNFGAAASYLAMSGMTKLEKKLRRSVELQASQVFQTGALTLTDEVGATRFTMNFSPKPAHFATAGTLWSNVAADAPSQIGDLATTIYQNGKALPTKLAFGKTAWRGFLANTAVGKLLDKQVLNRGALQNPPANKFGEIYQGSITIDSMVFDLYTYVGWYKHPQTGVMTPYLADNKVCLYGDGTDVVKAYGAIPQFPADASAADTVFLPAQIRSGDSSDGALFTPAGWLEKDRQSMTLQLAARPLVLPRGIDTFGCLTVL